MGRHKFSGGKCWCGRTHTVWSSQQRRMQRKPKREPSPVDCMTRVEWERECVLVGLYQMESDGLVRVVQTARGEAFEMVTGVEDAIRPMIHRRFEVVA